MVDGAEVEWRVTVDPFTPLCPSDTEGTSSSYAIQCGDEEGNANSLHDVSDVLKLGSQLRGLLSAALVTIRRKARMIGEEV